ncbi:MAG: hypothetical protein IAF58_11025 [Leptolyngbya sp.]|nr:hypothetical protein [Candidatus Melainabacteria bacterium]
MVGTQDWILVKLLKLEHDDEVFMLAKTRAISLAERENAGQLWPVVLQLGPEDQDSKVSAKQWLRKNQSHSNAKEIKRLLNRH